MANTMGGAMFLDPEIEAMVLALFCLMSIILVSLLIWLIFICLRVDGSVQWPWSVVFIPLWIVDVFVLWATIYRMKNYDAAKNEEMNRTQQEQQRQQRENDGYIDEQDGLLSGSISTSKLQHRCNQFIPFIQCCLVLVFQVLVVLCLDDYFDGNVGIVFIPFYLYQAINTVKNGRKGWSIRAVIFVQMTFILLQLEYIREGYSWFIVFIPLYCLGLFIFFKLYQLYKRFTGRFKGPAARQGQVLVTIGSVIYSIFAVLFYAVLGLMAGRLDGSSSIKLSVILIPAFIILVSTHLFVVVVVY